MKIILAVISSFLVLFVFLAWWVCTHIIFEQHEITPVKKLMVVQHFNSGQFAQLVDMSMLESHGLAKLDQYFPDAPFTEEEMFDAGFKLRNYNIDEAASIDYWKVVSDTELILVRSPQGDYWLWGAEEEEEDG